MSVRTLRMDDIEGQLESRYEAAVLISKRARQINSEINEKIKSELGDIEIDEESGEEVIDRESVISEFDKKIKPTSLAIEDFLAGRLEYEYTEDDRS
ncbi:DNA-directed RNA polymerase subunit omega [candidate division KSB1 bacterium]